MTLMHFHLTPHEYAALLLLLVVGRDAYFGGEENVEARDALDRIPTDHITSLFGVVESAIAAQAEKASV